MFIKDIFDVGEILEWEDKDTSIKTLDWDDCKIVSKTLNRQKVILHMQRSSDGSEGNVFVKLREKHEDKFDVSKKLLASKSVIGLSLNQFSNLDIDKL